MRGFCIYILIISGTFVNSLIGEFDSQLLKGIHIHCGKDGRYMELTAGQLRQLFQSKLRIRIGDRTHGERDQNLVGMKSRIAAAQIAGL